MQILLCLGEHDTEATIKEHVAKIKELMPTQGNELLKKVSVLIHNFDENGKSDTLVQWVKKVLPEYVPDKTPQKIGPKEVSTEMGEIIYDKKIV